MAFKPNYRFERAERDRLKQAKKDARLKRQQERALERQPSDEAPSQARETGSPES